MIEKEGTTEHEATQIAFNLGWELSKFIRLYVNVIKNKTVIPENVQQFSLEKLYREMNYNEKQGV